MFNLITEQSLYITPSIAATSGRELSTVCLFKYICVVVYSQSDGGSDSPLCQLTEFGYWISFRGTGLFVYLTI